MFSDEAVVAAAAGQVSCQIDDEVAVLHVRSGTYYGLDPVGARIWSLLEAPRTLKALQDTIVAEYDVAPEQCRRDLVALVQDLAAAGLVEVRDEPAR